MELVQNPKDLKVILETNELKVVDKPAGMSVHNESPREPSVLSFLRSDSLHLAHRLDKETSGILLLAKSSSIANEVMQALQMDESSKRYTVLLRGKWKDSETQLEWTWPLTDKGEGRRAPQGKAADRKACLTKVEVLHSSEYFTTIEATLGSGRQHQIRKHAALAGHPIVGDPRYNDSKYNEKIFAMYNISRMMLHARFLEFIFRNQRYSLEALLPPEFGTFQT